MKELGGTGAVPYEPHQIANGKSTDEYIPAEILSASC